MTFRKPPYLYRYANVPTRELLAIRTHPCTISWTDHTLYCRVPRSTDDIDYYTFPDLYHIFHQAYQAHYTHVAFEFTLNRYADISSVTYRYHRLRTPLKPKIQSRK